MLGQTINNFQIVRKLGSGGMGTVYEGLDLALQRRVAIKVLNPEVSRDVGFAERFQKEARVLARLNHPNLTSIYTFFRHDDQLFLVMEFIDGQRLDEIVKFRGALPWPEAVTISLEFLAGLEHAHLQGIVHRDVKPSNCLLTRDGRVKVTDFGIAHVAGHTRLTRTGDLIGTIEYMAPELIAGGEPDARADLYSLSAVLYELVTGHMPFTGSTLPELLHAQLHLTPKPPSTHVPQLPVWLEHGILRGLAKRPEERFQSAREMMAILQAGVGTPATGVTRAAVAPTRLAELPLPPPPPPPQPAPFRSASPAGGTQWILGVTAALALLAVVIVGFALFSGRTERPTKVATNEPVASPPPQVPAPQLPPSGMTPAVATPPPPVAIAAPPPPPPTVVRKKITPPPPVVEEPSPAPPPPAPPPPPPAPPPEPVVSDASLDGLSRLAGQLVLATEQLIDSYETSAEAAGRDPDAGAGEDFLDRLDDLEAVAEDLREACDDAAQKEQRQAAGRQPGAGRKILSKVRKLGGRSGEPREAVQREGQKLLQIGDRLATIRPQIEIEPAAQSDWRTVEKLLAEIKRTFPRVVGE